MTGSALDIHLPEIGDWGAQRTTSRIVHVDRDDPRSFDELGLSAVVVEKYLAGFRTDSVFHLAIDIDFEVPYPLTYTMSDGTQRSYSPEEGESTFKVEFVRSATHIAEELVLALNLARPAAREIGDRYTTSGTFNEYQRPLISNLWATRRSADDRGWPDMSPVPLRDAWRWIRSRGYFNSAGDTPAERAFNAYSRLFAPPTMQSVEELFWCLMGLEALFTDGPTGNLNQVVTRAQLLLGSMPELKKEFSRAYGVRSAFIHGGLPFPGRFFHYDALDAFDQYSRKIFDATVVAQTLLVASLRELVRRDWHDLRFTTVMDGSSTMPSNGRGS